MSDGARSALEALLFDMYDRVRESASEDAAYAAGALDAILDRYFEVTE